MVPEGIQAFGTFDTTVLHIITESIFGCVVISLVFVIMFSTPWCANAECASSGFWQIAWAMWWGQSAFQPAKSCWKRWWKQSFSPRGLWSETKHVKHRIEKPSSEKQAGQGCNLGWIFNNRFIFSDEKWWRWNTDTHVPYPISGTDRIARLGWK